jgi:hypothetical protein
VPEPGAGPGTSAGPVTAILRQVGELVAAAESLAPEVDWQKPIIEYLQLGVIPDDETET